ncbi:hypothetical protein DPMN_040245 [Dreissena polymorpha]|uniref:Mab-21-like nucleotidyltransferase domain-containing protein n=1 Tax=Dreissena polymorpha TaxID=45954 RepID=A0A9D4HSV8_DREPO|nr:hypothetical protein DPMN_040245 [Dreissena polymorpha]
MAEGVIGYSESETGSVPRHSSLYSRHSRNYVERVSVEISTIMTRLGYGEEIRLWRVAKYRELGKLHNKAMVSFGLMGAKHYNNMNIIAGSKAEGLTCHLESDIDLLMVLPYSLCVEAGINLHTIEDDIDLFIMDTRVYPGHCKLLLERQGSIRTLLINYSLCDNGYGDVLLRSSFLLDAYLIIPQLCPQYEDLVFLGGMVGEERAGPSLPHTDVKGIFRMDKVLALRCLCPSILNRWASRPCHWPSPVIVQKVVTLGAYLTPVGFKGSESKHMEWRICFNTGETELVNNLHDTQVKVYVILKMIVKDILKPNNKEITSYILKKHSFMAM